MPSIKVLVVSPKELAGRYVRYEMKPTGRTWTGTDGAEKTETVPVFSAVFKNEDECEVAAEAFFRAPSESEDDEEPSNDGEKATAAKFLPALWAQAKGDMGAFANLISGNPLTSQYFEMDSPEVLSVIG